MPHVTVSSPSETSAIPHSIDSIEPLYTGVDTSLSSSSQHLLLLWYLLAQVLVDRTSWHMGSKQLAVRRIPHMTEGDYSLLFLPPASTSSRSFHVRLVQPILFYNARFTKPTSLSNCPPPPHHGALLSLNFHLIPWGARWFWSCSCFTTPFNHFAAATKVRPLSEEIFLKRPFLAMNRLRCLMNSSAVWFGSNSRWTALVKLQANDKIYGFPFFLWREFVPHTSCKV